MTLKVCGMLTDGGRASTGCWGMVGSMWGVQTRVEICGLECFDCGLNLWFELDRQD